MNLQRQTFLDDGADATSLRRNMVAFLIPLVIGSVLYVLSGTISNIFIRKLAGETDFAAASTFIPFNLLILAFTMGLSHSTAILAGQAYGARDTGQIHAIAGTALLASFMLAVITSVVGYFTIQHILVVFGTSPDLLPKAGMFARASFGMVPILFLFNLYLNLTRGVGDSKSPLVALAIGTILGLALTPALIEGAIGLPRFGLAGAAYATGICQLVMIAVMAALQHRKGSAIALGPILGSIRVDIRILKTLLGIAGWVSTRMIIAAASEMIILFFVNGFGSRATAAYGAANQIFIYLQLLGFNFISLTTFFVAKEIGAGRAGRITGVCRAAGLLCFAVFGVFVAILYVAAHPVLDLFVRDPVTVEMAHHLLMITLWSYPAFGLGAMFVAVISSDGTKVPQTLIAAALIVVVEVPTVFFMSRWIGLDGVWAGYPAVFVAGLIFQGAYLLAWLKKPHERVV